jgi:hypothetical protein
VVWPRLATKRLGHGVESSAVWSSRPYMRFL